MPTDFPFPSSVVAFGQFLAAWPFSRQAKQVVPACFSSIRFKRLASEALTTNHGRQNK